MAGVSAISMGVRWPMIGQGVICHSVADHNNILHEPSSFFSETKVVPWWARTRTAFRGKNEGPAR